MATPRTQPRRVRFTKAFLQSLAPSSRGRDYWHDTAVSGLLVQVTDRGTKSFMVQRRVNGRPVRVTLGRFTVIGMKASGFEKRLLSCERI